MTEQEKTEEVGVNYNSDPDTGMGSDDQRFDFVLEGGGEWKVEIMPGFFWHPTAGLNWFHRLMSRHLLGWVWTKRV